MVMHYRWDFIGLSTDNKPTAATSSKVVNGSTFYCSDTSKLYVWYKDQWYERKPLGGGGGGGGEYTAGNGINISEEDVISVDTTTIQPLLTAGTNITISDNTISATDTTYSNFVGTDGTAAGTAGLVPAPATTDTDKFLKSDGTWATAGGGGSSYKVYSDKTTSNSDRGGAIYLGNLNASQVQFEDPTTTDEHRRYFWAIPYSNTIKPGDRSVIIGSEATSNAYSKYIGIGFNGTCEGNSVINIGGHYGRGNGAIVIGVSANTIAGTSGSIAIGDSAGSATSGGTGCISLGAYSTATQAGEMNIGSRNTSYGYNGTNYRVITGVHDGIDNHSAATVAQGNTLATSAPTTATEGVLGQLYTDTTNMHTYQCTAIDTTDPDNPSYTWTQRW